MQTDPTPPDDYIERLQSAIRRLNHCESKYVASVTISESFLTFQKQKLWEGEVAIFEIFGHSTAQRAYAWSHKVESETRYVVVLEVPPVRSPETAVQAAIAAQIVNGTFC
jgi:hypothetical protein